MQSARSWKKSEKSEVLEGGILSGKAQKVARVLNCNYFNTSTLRLKCVLRSGFKLSNMSYLLRFEKAQLAFFGFEQARVAHGGRGSWQVEGLD
jgi:hypothetical protein